MNKAKGVSLWNVWDLLREQAAPHEKRVSRFQLWVGCPHTVTDHKENPRVFAHTNCQKDIVCVHPALVSLPLATQAGILAHELGHLLAHLWWNDWSEEAADGAIVSRLGWPLEYTPPHFLQTLQGTPLRVLKERLP